MTDTTDHEPSPPPDGREWALSALGMRVGYGSGPDTVAGCDLRARPGEVVGVVGPNGAGKSTLLRSVFGLVPLRAGTISLHGRDLTGSTTHDRVRSGIGFVPQSRSVFPNLTVAENLRLGAYLHRTRYEQARVETLRRFPSLQDLLDEPAGLQSAGQQRVIGVARALMSDPSVLLLDEPSAGLAPSARDLVFDLVSRLGAEGRTVVMVEHDLGRCVSTCDRLAVLVQGRVVAEGRPGDLMADGLLAHLYPTGLSRS